MARAAQSLLLPCRNRLFDARQANAVHLAAELPLGEGPAPARVLYSASSKAGSDLQVHPPQRQLGCADIRMAAHPPMPVADVTVALSACLRHCKRRVLVPRLLQGWL